MVCFMCLSFGLLGLFIAVKVLMPILMPPRKTPYKSDWKRDVVYLYQFGRSPSIPNVSPFCLKLETWLRLARLKYEVVPIGLTIRSKEGTLPFVELNGVEYPDSSLAIRDLKRIFRKESLDDHDDEVCLGVARAIQSMISNSLFLSMAYSAWAEHTKQFMSPELQPSIKGWARTLLPVLHYFAPAMIMKRLKLAGIGRHEPTEIKRIGFEDIRAISQFLDDKPYFLGDKASSVDCAVFGAMAQLIYLDLGMAHARFLRNECPSLVAFCDRMKTAYWPDWKEATQLLQENTEHMKNL